MYNAIEKDSDIFDKLGVYGDDFFDERRAGAFVSPAGSVGASASQRYPPDTRTPPLLVDMLIGFGGSKLYSVV